MKIYQVLVARKNSSFFLLNAVFTHPKKYPNSSSTIIEEQRINGKGNTHRLQSKRIRADNLRGIMLLWQAPLAFQWILLLPKQPAIIVRNMKLGHACNDDSLHNSVEDDATFDATLSTDESEESSSFSEGDSSPSSESEDLEESEEVNLQQENETSQSQEEEPLYQGSKISKILSFVLIVSFVLKHNLSKAARADLLRLLTALLGERCRRTFQSVYI